MYLVVFGGVTKKVPEEVKMGARPDEDEVGRAVGEVCGGRQAFWTAGARAAHTGSIDGDELPADHPPTMAAIWKQWKPEDEAGLRPAWAAPAPSIFGQV